MLLAVSSLFSTSPKTGRKVEESSITLPIKLEGPVHVQATSETSDYKTLFKTGCMDSFTLSAKMEPNSSKKSLGIFSSIAFQSSLYLEFVKVWCFQCLKIA